MLAVLDREAPPVAVASPFRALSAHVATRDDPRVDGPASGKCPNASSARWKLRTPGKQSKNGGKHLLAVRPALLQYGVASEGEIDAALGHLAEAEAWEFEVLFQSLAVELVAQVPPSA
jgi:hypothetical protein